MSKPDFGVCQAMTFVEGRGYNLSRYIRAWESQPCDKRAVVQLGTLCLCKTHERMARDGFIGPAGESVDPPERAEWKRRDDAAFDRSHRYKTAYVKQRPWNWADMLSTESST